MTKPTQKQENFCLAYLETGNASEAYRRAYAASKMTAETIHKRSSELLKNGVVAGRMAVLRAAAVNLAVINRANVIKELQRVAFADIGKLYHPDGRVKLPYELDPDTRAAVKGFKMDEYGRVEYQFWDKPGTLVNVARIDGAFEKDNAQRVNPVAEMLAQVAGTGFKPVK